MTEEQKGESYIFGGAIIWSLFPIITVLSYKTVSSMVSLTVSTLLAVVPFFAMVLYKGRISECKNKLLWKYLFFIIVLNNIFYYGLYYFGLTKTTPGNASLIALFEVCTSYVFFHLIRKEHFSFESKIGSVCMVIGAAIVLVPNFSSLNFGDLFILIATFCAPVGNYFQQKAKGIASTETILFLRYLLSVPLLFVIALMFGQHFELGQIKESFLFLIFSGFVILGLSKIFWLEGIIRVAVTKAIALNSLATLFTLLVAWLVLHQTPSLWQLASLVPFFFGVLLLTNNLKLKRSA